MIYFEWDDNKNIINIQKHGISFAEAVSAFNDENSLQKDDPDHSDEEERFIHMGLSSKGRVLVIVFCYRDDEDHIRIISARNANKEEQITYFTWGFYERQL